MIARTSTALDANSFSPSPLLAELLKLRRSQPLLVAIGLKRRYNVPHPIKWVDDFAKFNDQKSNFFEAKVTNYSKGSISFDDF